MNIYELVLGVVLVAAAARVLMTIFGHGERHAEPESHAEADRLRDEVRHLRERVQVLERVVTDSNPAADLDRRIERLRD